MASLAALMLAAGAWAQRPGQPLLDLSGGPKAPAAGTGAGALALADDLASSAEHLSKSDDPRERARGAMRRVASTLLRTGERAGVAGSSRVLIGRTLADRMGEIDGAITGEAGPGSEARARVIEADALAAARTLEAPGADPWRTVRDGLALLADAAPGRAEEAPPVLASMAEAWQKLPGAGAGLALSVRMLEDVLNAAELRHAYRPTAQRLRATVSAAGVALGLLPTWVPEAARERLGAEFTRGVEGLLVREAHGAAEARLDRIARLGRIAARTDALETGAAGQRVRTALAQAMGASAPDPAAERRGLEAYERALELALARHTVEEEKQLIRALRPAWRAFVAAERQSEQSLYAALPELVRRPEAMTEPGIIATLNAARRAAEDLEGTRRLSAIMAGGEPEPSGGREPEAKPAWSRLSARVLKLSQDMAKPASREPALASLRRIIDQVPVGSPGTELEFAL